MHQKLMQIVNDSMVFIPLQNAIMYFPTWVDLKGEDSVPETVHHVVCKIDPTGDTSWRNSRRHVAVNLLFLIL